LKMSRFILEGVFAQIVYNGGDVNYTIGLLWALNEIILQYHQPLLNGVSCTLISCYYDLGFLSFVLQFISPFVALSIDFG